MTSQRSDEGITLIEVMVAMVLTGILGVVALGMFLSANKSTTATINTGISASTARATLDAWVATLQVATSPGSNTHTDPIYNKNGVGLGFYSVASDSVTFYANIGNRAVAGPASAATLVSLSWVSSSTDTNCVAASGYGCLVERRYDASNTTDPTVQRYLLNNVLQPATSTGTECTPSGSTSSASSTFGPRLFTACSGLAAIADSDVMTTANGTAGLTAPRSVTVAFTTVNTDSDGATHRQSFVAAAAVTSDITGTQG